MVRSNLVDDERGRNRSDTVAETRRKNRQFKGRLLSGFGLFKEKAGIFVRGISKASSATTSYWRSAIVNVGVGRVLLMGTNWRQGTINRFTKIS